VPSVSLENNVMNKNNLSLIAAAVVGAILGLIVGSLITWFPIRWAYCAAYNAPDCEEIVLIAFPLYCFIAPLIGGALGYFGYRAYVHREKKK